MAQQTTTRAKPEPSQPIVTVEDIDEALVYTSLNTRRDDNWHRWADALLDQRNAARHESRTQTNTPSGSHPVHRPCLDCGQLTTSKTRCDECRRAKDRARVRPHYGGDYRKRAKLVRESEGPCWLCGEATLPPGEVWTADHVVPADPSSPLAKAHRRCNSARGNRPAPPRT